MDQIAKFINGKDLVGEVLSISENLRFKGSGQQMTKVCDLGVLIQCRGGGFPMTLLAQT